MNLTGCARLSITIESGAMDRQQKIENIIIATLMESIGGTNYYDECRNLTADMFRDDVNRRIWNMIVEMNADGLEDTTPCGIFEKYGDAVADIVPMMCELVCDYSFIHLKAEYNERQYWMESIGPTDVSFTDYVNRFMINYYEGINNTGESSAA